MKTKTISAVLLVFMFISLFSAAVFAAEAEEGAAQAPDSIPLELGISEILLIAVAIIALLLTVATIFINIFWKKK